MEFLQYALALIVTLGVLVTFHELGHFVVARLSGVTVVRFSVGFGRPIWSRRDRHGTEFAIAYIPLGGYVRMLDEREPGAIEYQRRPEDVSYLELNVWWRIAIAAGGPLANFLLALLVYWFLFVVGSTTYAPMLGAVEPDSPGALAGLMVNEEIVAIDATPTGSWQQVNMALASRLGDTGTIEITTQRPGTAYSRTARIPVDRWQTGVDEPDLLDALGITPGLPAIVAEVLDGSAAQKAGIERWDLIVAADGKPLADWDEWVDLVQKSPGRALQVRVDRGGREVALTVTPDTQAGPDGEPMGYVGVGVHVNEVRYGVLQAVSRSFAETADKTLLTLSLLKKMVIGQVSVKNLSGPITIAKVAGDSARSGWRFFLGVLALLSISLGVLNLLPIPILDGGHILFCSAEAVMGKPVSERVQIVGTQIGLFVVAGLMMLAIYNDLTRLF